MLSCVLVLLLWATLLFPANSFAQGVCFDDKVAGDMVVALEQAKIAEQQLEVAAGTNEELLKQKEILKETIKLREDQIAVFKSMAEMQNTISIAKDKVCEERVKAATPTFMDNVTKYMTGAAGGAILFGLILLAL
jgi:hypothetical protein